MIVYDYSNTERSNRLNSLATIKNDIEPRNFINYMIGISVRGLEGMFDAKNQLFCYRTIKFEHGVHNEGLSLRYTIISLMGLYMFEACGGKSNIDIRKVFSSLLEKLDRFDNIGDVGLLLWLCSLFEPNKAVFIFNKLRLIDLIKINKDAIYGRTMELSWLLTGLTYLSSIETIYIKDLKVLTEEIYKNLLNNYRGMGIFGHVKKNIYPGGFRSRIGSFADQVYPIYALSKYSTVFGDKNALEIGLKCGESICRSQGEFGQWWWHYDADSGRVIGKYPVFSVHQDGMAPMALFALGKAAGKDFSVHVNKGLHWITGNNELNVNMIDESRNTIWRSMYLKKYIAYKYELLSLLNLESHVEKRNLNVLYETRPYHFGWLLYAFCNVNNTGIENLLIQK